MHGGIHFHPAQRQSQVPRQLPGDPTGFVGRQRELQRLQELASRNPQAAALLVVAGTAGSGKTALALHFAHSLHERFPDGQLFVNLRGYDTSPPLAPQTALERFIRALGVSAQSIPLDIEEQAELYRSLIANRHMLIVLDNAATTGQVRPLLPGEPGSLVLVTTRNRLSGLAARNGAQRLTLGLLPQAQAVELIETSTTGYRADDDPRQVTELVQLCARLPLALRIAAERAAARPWMPLRELIADLRNESALWDALSIQDGEEADAVRAVFAWSYRALPPAAALAFRRLGIHPGPDISKPAAAAITGQPLEQITAMLDLLTGAHLIEQISPHRYQFHDLLRAYAADQARVEEDQAQQLAALLRLAVWYLHSASAAAHASNAFRPPQLDGAPDGSTPPMSFDDYDTAMAWHTTEQANLLAMVRATHAAGLDRVTWQLSATLHALHIAHAPLPDWVEMATLGLESAHRLHEEHAEALLHESLGAAYKAAGHLAQAADEHRAAYRIHDRLGEQSDAAASAHSLGLVLLQQRNLDQARESFEHTLQFAQQPAHHAWKAPALCCLAYTHAEAGDLRRAAELAEQSLTDLAQQTSAPYLRIDPLLLLARIEREQGHLQAATAHLDRAAAVLEPLDHSPLEQAALLERAHLAHAAGSHQQALELYWQYVNQRRTHGDSGQQALAVGGIALTLRALGRLDEAIEFHRAAAQLGRRSGDPWRCAVVLADLSDTLDTASQTDRAEAVRAEAHLLLRAFTDKRATSLRRYTEPHGERCRSSG